MGEETDDLAGGFSKYRDELLARTGVDIEDATGHYRDLYDIFVDIAKVWDNLADDQSRARVGEILGGTRNQAAIMSTIQNIKDAIGAYDSAMNSAGVATSANEKYMETTAAHIQQLKTSFQELSADVFKSDFLKFFVDLGRGIIEVIDAIIDKIGILGALLSAGGIFATAKFGLGNIIASLQLAAEHIAGLVTAAGGLSSVLSVAFPVAGVVALIAVLATLSGSYESAKNAADKANDAYKNTQGDLSEVNSELEKTKIRIEELESKGSFITPIEQEELNKLREYNDELEREKTILEQTSQIWKEEAGRESNNALTKETSWSPVGTMRQGEKGLYIDSFGEGVMYGSIVDKINDYTDAIREQYEAYDNVSKKLLNESDKKERGRLEEQRQKIKKVIDKYSSQRAKDIESASKYYDAIVSSGGYDETASKWEEAIKAASASTRELSNIRDNTIGSAFKLSKDSEKLFEWYDKLSEGDKELVYTFVINNSSEARHEIETELDALGEGGNVNLNLRPVIDTKELADAGWDEAAGHAATVFTSTFSNKAADLGRDDGIAMNFTPIIADEKGNFKGVLSPEELEKYANDVISGIREDDLGLKIGATFVGKNAIDDAVEAAEKIHELHEQKYLTPSLGDMSLSDYDELIQKVGEDVEETTEEAVDVLEEITQRLDDTNNRVNEITKSFSSLQSALSSQGTGKSLSLDIFNSEELQDYASALEYHNGVLQYNVDKVNEIAAAKAEEEKATISANKAQAQSQYLKNAGEIEQLRFSMRGMRDEEARANKQERIDTLLKENSVLAQQCTAYDLMTASINEASSAYQHWINAQKATQSGDMFDSALSAINKIRDVINGSGDDNSADGWLKTGNADYKAAVDFVIPDSVDKEDASAVESYIQSVKSYFRFDNNGGVNGLNVEKFLQDSVNAGLMTVDESGDKFKVAGQKTMQDFANGLGLSLPLVQAAFGELEEYDFHFDWADEVPKTLGDMAMEANEAKEALLSIEEYSNIKLVLDVTKFTDTSKAIDTLDANIKEMNRIKAKVKVDSSEAQYANYIIQYCVAQKQALSEPVIMSVDTSQVTGAIGEALSLMQQFQDYQNTKELMTSVNAEADTSQVDSAINDVVDKINSLPDEVKMQFGIEGEASIENVQNAINNITSAEQLVKFGVDESAIVGYQPENKDAEAIYGVNDSAVKKYTPSDKHAKVIFGVNHSAVDAYDPDNLERTVTYTYKTEGTRPSTVNGTAHVNGTAAAGGNWGTAVGGTTLVGELGREIVVDPNTGRWYTVGENGAEFVNIPKGAIVFNHLQTESLLENGYAIGRAVALASGTAMVTGEGKRKKKKDGGGSGGSGGSGGGDSDTKKKKKKKKHHSSDDDSSDSSDKKDKNFDKFKEWLSKLFDWIEVRIERTKEKIDRYIDRAKRNEETGNYNGASKNYVDAIKQTTALIKNSQAGATRYQQQAESVISKARGKGLISENEAKEIAKRYSEGTIDISEYSEKVQEVVKAYKDWMDKSRELSNSIETLQDNVRGYIDDLKKMRDAQRDATLSSISFKTSIGTNGSNNTVGASYSQLRYKNTQLSNENKAYTNEVALLNRDVSKIAGVANGGINAELKKKKKIDKSLLDDPKYVDSILNRNKGLTDAQKYIKKRIKIPTSILNRIAKTNTVLYTKLLAYNAAIAKLEEAKLEDALHYSEASAETYKNINDIYSKLDSKTNNNIELLRARSANSNDTSTKNGLLNATARQYDNIVKRDNQEIAEYNKYVKSNSRIISNKNGVTGTVTALSAKKRKSINSVINSAKNAVKKGTYIPSGVLAAIAKYYSKGYITSQFYKACVDYNNALDNKEQAIAQRDIDKETAKQKKIEIGSEKLSNVQSKYQLQSDKVNAEESYIREVQNTKTTRGGNLSKKDYQNLIKKNSADQNIYRNEYAELQRTINNNIKNGLWTKATPAYKEALNLLADYKRQIQECTTKQEEYNNAIAQLPFDNINRSIERLNTLSDYYNSITDLKKSRGITVSKADYLRQIGNNNQLIKKYTKESELAYKNYLKAMSSNGKVFGGKSATEWLNIYRDAKKEINEVTAANQELNNSIVQLPFDKIDKALERLDEISNYYKSINDLKKSKGINLVESDYLMQIDVNNQEIKEYAKESRIAYNNYRKALTSDGNVYGGKSAVEWLNIYRKAKKETNELASANQELRNSITQLPFDAIDRTLNRLGKISDYYKSINDLKKSKGINLVESDYLRQIATNNQELREHEKESGIAYNNYRKALASTDKVYGGKSAVEWLNEYREAKKAINDITSANQELRNSIVQLPFDAIDRTINRLDKLSDYYNSINNLKKTSGINLVASDYLKQIDVNNQKLQEYTKESRIAYNNYRKALASTGNVYGGKSAVEWLNTYREAKKVINELTSANQELNNSIAQLPFDVIDNALGALDKLSRYYESASNLITSEGRDLSESDYMKQINTNIKKIDQYSKEMEISYSNYLKALSESGRVYGGKSATEWLNIYRDAASEVYNIKASNEELKNSLRDDVYWRNFVRAHDAAKRLSGVLNGISNLIDKDMYFDKDGNITKFGISQIANLTKEYENARTEVSNYSKDIKNLNKLYKDGQYTEIEYKEKLAELQEGVLSSASNMKDYLESIKEIYKDMDESELEALYKLIDKRNEALQKKKEYYDYDKSIRNKTKDIQELNAQIAALEGINTAEAKSKKAKLQEQLSKANEELDDMQTNHYYDLSKDALDGLKDTLQDTFDNKWDTLGQDLTKMAQLLADANTLAKDNASMISKTLNSILKFYGIDASATGIKKSFASGTRRVGGSLVGLSNEAGNEIIVTKNGIVSHFNPGDGVVPADLTKRLYDLAQGNKPNTSIGNTSVHGVAGAGGVVEIAQHYDSLVHIDGNADAVTVGDLQRLSKQILEKSYDYTTRRIKQDYLKTGGLRKV